MALDSTCKIVSRWAESRSQHWIVWTPLTTISTVAKRYSVSGEYEPVSFRNLTAWLQPHWMERALLESVYPKIHIARDTSIFPARDNQRGNWVNVVNGIGFLREKSPRDGLMWAGTTLSTGKYRHHLQTTSPVGQSDDSGMTTTLMEESSEIQFFFTHILGVGL